MYNELIYQQKHQSQQQWRNTSLQFDQNNVNKRDEIEVFPIFGRMNTSDWRAPCWLVGAVSEGQICIYEIAENCFVNLFINKFECSARWTLRRIMNSYTLN